MFLITLVLSLIVVSYIMWRKRSLLIMKLVHLFRKYEDNGTQVFYISLAFLFYGVLDAISDQPKNTNFFQYHFSTGFFSDEGEIYDAFISYRCGAEDEAFVVKTLFHRLETVMRFKLCVHFRDFQVGRREY